MAPLFHGVPGPPPAQVLRTVIDQTAEPMPVERNHLDGAPYRVNMTGVLRRETKSSRDKDPGLQYQIQLGMGSWPRNGPAESSDLGAEMTIKHVYRATCSTLALTAALAFLQPAGAVFAQDGAQEEGQNSAPEAAVTDERGNRIETIIVTGEKVDRSLQETVTSVGIVTGEQLEQDAIVSLGDAFDYIANVNLGNSEGGFSIRGIPFDNLLGAGSAPLAQIYVDDVTLGDQTTRFGANAIWDVAQVEVLRGAQSTVQGRNALAGAIIIRTVDPTYEWTGKARSIYLNSDEGDEYSYAFALGGPIIDDVLAFRVSGERRESDGYVSNPVTGEDGADFYDQWQGRVKLLFEPVDSVRALFTFNYVQATVADALSDRRSRDENGFVNFTDVVPGNESLRQTYVNVPDFNENTQYNYSLRVSWDVNDAITLTSITAYSDATNDERLDTDGTNLDPSSFPQGPVQINNPFNIPTVPSMVDQYEPSGTQLEEQTIFTQEITAYYDAGGRFRALGGLYYVDSSEEEFNFTPGIQTGILGVVEGATRPGVEATLVAELAPLRGVPFPGNPVGAIPPGPEGDAFFDAFIAAATDGTVNVILNNYTDIGSFIALTSEPLDVQNFAAYVRGEYDVTNRLTVGFGIRYDTEEQEEGLTLSGDPLGLPNPAAPALPEGFEPLLVPVVQGSIALVNGFFDATLAEASTSATQSFDAWLPSGFIRYDIDEDRSVSFSMRRGYRAGGSDLNIPRQFVSQFDPEFTLNYELALRSYWFDRSLLVNANAFYTDWEDQQVVVGLSTLQQDEVGFNVGSSRVFGFEIDALWQPTDNISIQGVLGYSDTEFEDFDTALAEALIEAQNQTAPIDLDEVLNAFNGQEFGFAPNWSGAFRVTYEADNGLFGTVGVTYEGESFVNNANSASGTFLNNDSRVLVNLTTGYRYKGVTLAFVATNLFDEEYVSSGGDERVRLGAPREIGVRVQADF